MFHLSSYPPCIHAHPGASQPSATAKTPGKGHRAAAPPRYPGPPTASRAAPQ